MKDMIGLLQRVRRASVEIEGQTVASIGPGLLVLVGIERGDTDAMGERLIERLLGYRVFEDDQSRMNRSLRDLGAPTGETAGGGLLLVSQFTLAADTQRGTRPSFTPAMPPDDARVLYTRLVRHAQREWPGTQNGVFGANMQVSLVNDGPVTFQLRVTP